MIAIKNKETGKIGYAEKEQLDIMLKAGWEITKETPKLVATKVGESEDQKTIRMLRKQIEELSKNTQANKVSIQKTTGQK